MQDMVRRVHPPALIAFVAVLLAVAATLTLGSADAAVAGAVILGLVVIAGIGVGLSVGSPDARH